MEALSTTGIQSNLHMPRRCHETLWHARTKPATIEADIQRRIAVRPEMPGRLRRW